MPGTWSSYSPPRLVDEVIQPAGAVDLQPTPAGTPVDVTGTDLLLPAAGTYLLTANVRGALNASPPNNAFLQAWLFNVTAGIDVPFTARIINQISRNAGVAGESAGANNTTPISRLYTVTVPTTIRIRAARSGVSATALIVSNANGWTNLMFEKIR